MEVKCKWREYEHRQENDDWARILYKIQRGHGLFFIIVMGEGPIHSKNPQIVFPDQ